MNEKLKIDWLTTKEAAQLFWRRPNYITMILGLYLLPLTMRASYYPIRLFDDLLDGDARGINNEFFKNSATQFIPDFLQLLKRSPSLTRLRI